jgi:hypothetical protein
MSITIPNSVISIGDSCFESSGLMSLTIPSSVTTLGTYSFRTCSDLTSVTIPSSVTSIGDACFYGSSSSNLTSLTFGNPSTINTNITNMLVNIQPGTVRVIFNNTAVWDDLNDYVKNYFTQTPPTPVRTPYVCNHPMHPHTVM